MSRRAAVIVGAVVLAGALGVSEARAEDVVRFTTDFAFKAGKQELPAGTYTLRTVGDNVQIEVIEGVGTKAKAEVPVRTRLGEDPVPQTNLVFDIADGAYILSEVQVPHEDGYLVGWAPAAHTHRVVHATAVK